MSLLVLVALLAPLPPAHAATQAAQWWESPATLLDGHHVRIPFAVTNDAGVDATNAIASVDVDVRKALLDAGWASGRTGAGVELQAFELDPASVRVVEYRELGTGGVGDGVLASAPEAPAEARLGYWDKPGTYNARTAPNLHVDWVLEGTTPAGATRYYMIYLDTLANGPARAPAWSEAERAPLAARAWIARGTTLVGRASTLDVFGLEDGTRVLVQALVAGKAQPLQGTAAGAGFENPLVLDAGVKRSIPLSTEPVLLVLESDKPIVAAGRGDAANATVGPVASADGGVLGRRFAFHSAMGFALFAPAGSAHARVKAGDDAPTEHALSPGAPLDVMGAVGQDVVVESDAPILALLVPTNAGKAQWPSVLGAPVGSRLVGWPLTGSYCSPDGPGGPGSCSAPPASPPCTYAGLALRGGELVVSALDNRTALRARDVVTGQVTLPAPDAADEPVAQPLQPYRVPVAASDRCLQMVHAAPAGTDKILEGASLVVFGGAAGSRPAILHTPLGGQGGQRFETTYDVDVIALHNATTVRASGGTSASFGLAAGNGAHVSASVASPVVLEADKPVVVLPLGQGSFFAGLDASIRARQLGPASYAGYLVNLVPQDGAPEPLVGLAAPGRPASFALAVQNLAQDTRGRGVADDVELRLPELPPGWSASLSTTLVHLDAGERKPVALTVTPPADASEGASLTLAVTAASRGNPRMADHIQVVTLVRAQYGVGLWFEREGGARTQTVVLDSGATGRVGLVVKNTAVVPDEVLVSVRALSSEWSCALDESGAARKLLPLGASSASTLDLRIAAPARNASQGLCEVTAVSSSDSSAAAKASATLRIRADVKIAVDVDVHALDAPPGGELRFALRLRNLGSDAVGVRFNSTGVLPEGWSRPRVLHGADELDELEGLLPGSVTSLVVVQTIPEGAQRGERAALHVPFTTLPAYPGDQPVTEDLDLLALAGARHNVTLDPPALEVDAEPDGALEASFRVANEGNGNETLRVEPGPLPEGATLALPAPLHVRRGGHASLLVAARLDPATPPGRYPVALDLVSDDGARVPATLDVVVSARSRIQLAATQATEVIAGRATRLALDATNAGNTALELPPRLALPDGWSARWENASGVLAPGAQRRLDLVLTLPADAPSGERALVTDDAWAQADALPLAVRHVTLRATEEGPGRIRVENLGDGDATEVAVELRRGGELVDAQVLHRVPAGASVVASLVGSGGDLRARVDAQSRYGQPIDVALAGTGREAPANASAALILLLAALALARRR